jgi:hypothetical protein
VENWRLRILPAVALAKKTIAPKRESEQRNRSRVAFGATTETAKARRNHLIALSAYSHIARKELTGGSGTCSPRGNNNCHYDHAVRKSWPRHFACTAPQSNGNKNTNRNSTSGTPILNLESLQGPGEIWRHALPFQHDARTTCRLLSEQTKANSE